MATMLTHDERQVWAADGEACAPKLVADAVCGPRCTQEEVYAHLRGAVAAALGGKCGSVVCCGGAGAGKTHSLLNAHIGEWGVAPRALGELFRGLADGGAGSGAVRASCALLCREKWHDLLRPAAGGGGGGGGGGGAGARAAAPAPAAVVQRGGVLDGHRWEEARAARDAMLLLQRAGHARAQVRYRSWDRDGGDEASVGSPRRRTPPHTSPPRSPLPRSFSPRRPSRAAASAAPTATLCC